MVKNEHRIVFLDLDQVLFDYQTTIKRKKIHCQFERVNESCDLLKAVLMKTDAKVVFVSSWGDKKLITALAIGELHFLKPFLHERPFVDRKYRCAHRTSGIHAWFCEEYESFDKMQEIHCHDPLVLNDESLLRFAIVDDSTGTNVYSGGWVRSRLVPVINQRFGNFEANLLEALLTGNRIGDMVSEMERRASIYSDLKTDITLGMQAFDRYNKKE